MTAHLLWQGIKNQIYSDSTETAQEMMRFVLAQRPGVRALNYALDRSARTPLPSTFAILNGLRCYARMAPTGPLTGVLACGHRSNERHALAAVRSAIGDDMPWCDIDFELRGATGALRALDSGELRALYRISRLAHRVQQSHELFQSLRAVELMFHYARLSKILDEGQFRIAVMSSYSNPWGIALNIAARRRGIPVVLVMHGMPLWPIARLDYDLAIVNNLASYETLVRAKCGVGRYIVKSGRARYRPMPTELPAKLTIGVLLSKEPSAERVTSSIAQLLDHPRVESVVVRKHPANLWRGLDSAIAVVADRVSISSSPSSFDDIARCHVVLAGNSSVHIDALTAGVPSIFVPGLDHAPDDVLAFVQEGLVLSRDQGLDVDELLRFYARSSWPAILRRHVNIDSDEQQVADEIRAAFAELGARA